MGNVTIHPKADARGDAKAICFLLFVTMQAFIRMCKQPYTRRATWLLLLCSSIFLVEVNAEDMPLVRVSQEGTHFVAGDETHRFTVWGVNYDHDQQGRLLDEYWIDEWDKVEEDFAEIKSLGANCVRIHLQLGKFMETRTKPNAAALRQLRKVVELAESHRLYLNVTGLACYHQKNIPEWYDKLSESERWEVQATFWRAIADTCKRSPAIFCYDLMNEPILPGQQPEKQWLAGELDGKYFVQRLTLDLAGRSREEVAAAWVKKMCDAIRHGDTDHMITVGVIPWVFVFGGGKPLFYSPPVSDPLDFVSVHFYPKSGEVEKAIKALQAYDIGKPLVVEEMFPLACSEAELVDFVKRSSSRVDGWISFYWGATSEQLRGVETPTIAEALTASWLETFKELSTEFAGSPVGAVESRE